MPRALKQLAQIRELPDKVIRLHGEVLDSGRRNLEKALRIGELLAEQKRTLGHGEWLPWVAEHLPFSDRTARSYIRLHRKRDLLKSETVSDLGAAFALLRDSKPQKPKDRSKGPAPPPPDRRPAFDLDAEEEKEFAELVRFAAEKVFGLRETSDLATLRRTVVFEALRRLRKEVRHAA